MKTVFFIASIILLSYQIDQFSSNDATLFPALGEKPTLAAALAQNHMNIDTNETVRSVKKMKKETSTFTTSAAKKAVAVKQVKKVKTKFALHQSKKVNHFASALHHNIKESGNYLAMNSVAFEHNDYTSIKTDEFNIILQYADKLIFDKSLKISIAGFADNTGNINYNEELSLMRALNVQRYLVDLGVDENRIILSANGIAEPIANNNTYEGRALNRRVEMALFQQDLAYVR